MIEDKMKNQNKKPAKGILGGNNTKFSFVTTPQFKNSVKQQIRQQQTKNIKMGQESF